MNQDLNQAVGKACLLTRIQGYNQNIYGRAAHIFVSGTVD
jgi:hypothetical protein